MSKHINVILPDGYEDTTHLVLVAPDDPTGWAVTVLKVEERGLLSVADQVVEEVGCGGLTALMTDAARVVRTGTAVKVRA